MEHKGLDPLRGTLDAVSYRLTFGLVLAALIIGSAIMVHISTPRFIHTMGVIGFVIGAVFSVILLALSVFRTFKE